MFEFYKKSTELYNSTFELQQKQAKILSGKVPVNMPPPPPPLLPQSQTKIKMVYQNSLFCT